MKGLRKYLAPFTPDISGAASVLYALGGLIVISDAGGCTGNVCGFDEPRWSTQKSAIFSAGLRDIDAILGRDDRFVDKIELAARQLTPPLRQSLARRCRPSSPPTTGRCAACWSTAPACRLWPWKRPAWPSTTRVR